MKRVIVLLIALVVACTSVPNKPGSVQGKVTDRGGNPLPGVTVTLHTSAGDQAAITDEQGDYQFQRVPPGKYEIQVWLAGFREARLQDNLREGKDARRDVAIASAAATEAITVTAASPTRVDRIISGIAGGMTRVAQMPMAVPVEPQNTAKYAAINENGFVDTRKEKTTTFSIDVDGASYANVRRFLNANTAP